jgi:hypothetical protein
LLRIRINVDSIPHLAREYLHYARQNNLPINAILLFVLIALSDRRVLRDDQGIELRHKGDEPHEIAGDECDDQRRAPCTDVQLSG